MKSTLNNQELKQKACAAIERRKKEVIGVAQEILSHPEPGFRETKTSSLVARKFDELGIHHRPGLAMTGVKGRITGSEIARREKLMDGRVPLHTLRADIDYSITEAKTAMGRIGVKVWIYKGEVVPPPPEETVEEMETIEVTVHPEETADVTT